YIPARRLMTPPEPDGNLAARGYNAAGTITGIKVNGRWISQVSSDLATRTRTMTDSTRDDATVIHCLTYNRTGQLIERETEIDGQPTTTRWEYDADEIGRAHV